MSAATFEWYLAATMFPSGGARLTCADFAARVAAFLPHAMGADINSAPITPAARERLVTVEKGISATLKALGGKIDLSEKSAHHFDGAVVNALRLGLYVPNSNVDALLKKLVSYERMSVKEVTPILVGTSVSAIYWTL